jgi:hypothetical protein
MCDVTIIVVASDTSTLQLPTTHYPLPMDHRPWTMSDIPFDLQRYWCAEMATTYMEEVLGNTPEG